jgi:hypothetical protein
LFALPVRLALAAARVGGDDAAAKLGGTLALAYQILDDIRDRDADAAAHRVNICQLIAPETPAVAQAHRIALEALETVRTGAADLPGQAGAPFCNLADRMESALMEHADAA